MKWKNEKENLEKLILEEHKTYEEIGRLYSCTGANIKKVAIRLGINLPQKRRVSKTENFNRDTGKIGICKNCGIEYIVYQGCNGKYCSNKCQQEYQHKLRYDLILNGDESIMRANYSPRAFYKDILKEQGNKCDICKCYPEHNGKELVFIIDHIDGHASNNKRSNLRCICPNCDSQLDTYKSKNKCGERSYYRYHKNKPYA